MQMVDVGCGIGGSSRYISRKFGCTAQGITLSPVQVLTCNLAFFLLAQEPCEQCLCQPARSAVSLTRGRNDILCLSESTSRCTIQKLMAAL